MILRLPPSVLLCSYFYSVLAATLLDNHWHTYNFYLVQTKIYTAPTKSFGISGNLPRILGLSMGKMHRYLSVSAVFIFGLLLSDDCRLLHLINDRVMLLANQGWHYFLVYEHQRGSHKSQKVRLCAAEEPKWNIKRLKPLFSHTSSNFSLFSYK